MGKSKMNEEIKEYKKLAGIKKLPLTQRVRNAWFSFIEGITVIGAMILLLLWVGYCNITKQDVK